MFYDYPLTKRQLWPVGLFCSPWPEQALRANIHCQISLALNRIYTEWYPSKGYTFNITNSTSYDQYYVHGRTVFDVMVRLTDDIFNTYIRKTGTVNPYYAEYCDGKSVTCPGLKQWGTVTLANQGRNALSILKYYYGNNIEIIRTNNIQSIPQSYPGSPLRQGSTGAAVFTLQRQLNRITKDYPFLGLLTVDGIFGRKMTETVKKFQRQFNLTAVLMRCNDFVPAFECVHQLLGKLQNALFIGCFHDDEVQYIADFDNILCFIHRLCGKISQCDHTGLLSAGHINEYLGGCDVYNSALYDLAVIIFAKGFFQHFCE